MEKTLYGHKYALTPTTHYVTKVTHAHDHAHSPYVKTKFLKGLCIARHNNAIYQLTNMFKLFTHTRYFTFANASTRDNAPQDNTIPSWLLNCTCNTPKCTCLVKLRPYIIYMERSGIGTTWAIYPKSRYPHTNF